MKRYNFTNYGRYLIDLETSLLPLEDKEVLNFLPVPEEIIELIEGEDAIIAKNKIRRANKIKRDELIIKFMPLSESLARKFSQTEQAIGPLTVLDLIQEGCVGLIESVDQINWEMITAADNPLQRMQSRLSKGIKGRIRRSIDEKATPIRLPENHLTAARKSLQNGDPENPFVVNYYNSFFSSVDSIKNKPSINGANFNGGLTGADDSSVASSWENIPDSHSSYLNEFNRKYLLSIMAEVLTKQEYDVLRLAYGLSERGLMTSEQIASSKVISFTDDQSEEFGSAQEIINSLSISKLLKISLKNEHTNIQTVNNIKKNAIAKLKRETTYEKLKILIE
tara:strand:+ start:281 stop:1291 length:1011 start_codon:yes stop_codon:yes gene_type:complete